MVVESLQDDEGLSDFAGGASALVVRSVETILIRCCLLERCSV